MVKTVYMEVTKDKYELPLFVADSRKEIALHRNVDEKTVKYYFTAQHERRSSQRKWKIGEIVKVDYICDDPEETTFLKFRKYLMLREECNLFLKTIQSYELQENIPLFKNTDYAKLKTLYILKKRQMKAELNKLNKVISKYRSKNQAYLLREYFIKGLSQYRIGKNLNRSQATVRNELFWAVHMAEKYDYFKDF